MAIFESGDAAVVRNGDLIMIMISPSPEVAGELRGLLAKANSEGVGDTSRELRQLLYDVEAAMQKPFRATGGRSS